MEWTKETYEASVSSRCWWYTRYGDGGDPAREYGCDIAADTELRQIVEMEHELDGVPEWAQQVVERSINFLPGCGHYLFPQPQLEAVSAIGSETPPDFVHGCYTVERERKRQMMDYVLCLDAWLAGGSPDAVGAELMALGYRQIDWPKVCSDLWKVLGKRTELKELLIERLIHSQRWKIKQMAWEDDLAPAFGRDEYLGDYAASGCEIDGCTYVSRPLPNFVEDASPRVQKLEARLAEICPDWEWFRYTIQYGWLCAPKAFRFLERLLWAIGKERRAVHTHDNPLETGDKVPGFLQCVDTYPNPDEVTGWQRAFVAALRGWWRGERLEGNVANEVNQRLGEPTPVKRWLVRLLVHKLELGDTRHVAPG
ncbi:MAG TPA: hypothetical protein HPP77_02050 [Candidatus Hydrogenedentes bacterium]|nr:hypothetical protein [Candidatus Hydrogenedentota bacterium]HIJ74154.1 hypothetical protein [Candidatus Hydrogenedentota bacterium]